MSQFCWWVVRFSHLWWLVRFLWEDFFLISLLGLGRYDLSPGSVVRWSNPHSSYPRILGQSQRVNHQEFVVHVCLSFSSSKSDGKCFCRVLYRWLCSYCMLRCFLSYQFNEQLCLMLLLQWQTIWLLSFLLFNCGISKPSLPFLRPKKAAWTMNLFLIVGDMPS